jgi:hypothetical protein
MPRCGVRCYERTATAVEFRPATAPMWVPTRRRPSTLVSENAERLAEGDVQTLPMPISFIFVPVADSPRHGPIESNPRVNRCPLTVPHSERKQVVERLSQFEHVLDSGAAVPSAVPKLLDPTAATSTTQQPPAGPSPFGLPVDESGSPSTGIELVDCDGVGFWDCDVSYLLQVRHPPHPGAERLLRTLASVSTQDFNRGIEGSAY